jgi:uncharacterized protein (TIGR03435 family)
MLIGFTSDEDLHWNDSGRRFVILRMPRILLIAGLVLAYAAASGQAAESPAFEVASVKPSPPPDPNGRVFFGPPRGGPGSHDPGRITWTNAALRNILMTAYDVQVFQINAPEWLSTTRYDIAVIVPAGATSDQVNVMWQNLLKERFGLVLHREPREFQAEALTVARGGPKLKATDLDPDAEPFTPTPDGPPGAGKAPEMNGTGLIVTISPGAGGMIARMFGKGLTLPEIAVKLGQQLHHPVVDRTGLTGRYDFTLEYTLDPAGMPPGAAGAPPGAAGAPDNSASEPGSNVNYALEKQLGLKLTASREKLDVIVVDHVERTPTGN